MHRKLLFLAGTVCVTTMAVFVAVSQGSASATTRPQLSLDVTPAAGTSSVAHQTQIADDASWSVTSITNSEGQLCAGVKTPTTSLDPGQAWSCWNPASLFKNGPVIHGVGGVLMANGYAVWVWGIASSDVARVNLKLTDCTTLALPVDAQGYFMHVFTPDQLRTDIGPASLTALSGSGAAVTTFTARPSVIPSPSANACGNGA